MDIYGMFFEHPKMGEEQERSDPFRLVWVSFQGSRQGHAHPTHTPITSFRFVSPRPAPASVRWGPGPQ